MPAGCLRVILGQLVTLYRGDQPVRMSKRTGEMITFEEVLEETGPDATRFFLVMMSPDSHMDFDLELAKKQTMDNPVYYVQYAHARASNIIANSNSITFDHNNVNYSLLTETAEMDLIKKLIEFPNAVKEAAISMQPHHIARYSRELASLFHSYYHKCRVISDDIEIMKARLVLIQSVKIVISNSLKLLGISAPEKM